MGGSKINKEHENLVTTTTYRRKQDKREKRKTNKKAQKTVNEQTNEAREAKHTICSNQDNGVAAKPGISATYKAQKEMHADNIPVNCSESTTAGTERFWKTFSNI